MLYHALYSSGAQSTPSLESWKCSFPELELLADLPRLQVLAVCLETVWFRPALRSWRLLGRRWRGLRGWLCRMGLRRWLSTLESILRKRCAGIAKLGDAGFEILIEVLRHS